MQFVDDHLKISRAMCTKGKLFQLGFQPFKATWRVYVDLLVLTPRNLPMTIKISGTSLWRCSTSLHWLEQRCMFHRNPWILCRGQSQKIPSSQYDKNWLSIIRVQHVIHCCSVAQSCLTLCDPVDCSTPGLPVHYQLPKFTQNWLLINKNFVQICAAHRPNVGNPPTLPLPAKRHSLWLNWPTLRTRRVRQPTNSEQVQTYLHQVAKTIKCSTMSPNLWLDSLRPQGHWLGFIAGPFKFGTVVIDRISDSCLCSYDRAVTRVLFRSVLSELQCPLPLTSCISYLGGLILTVDSDDLASPGGLSLTGGIFSFL